MLLSPRGCPRLVSATWAPTRGALVRLLLWQRLCGFFCFPNHCCLLFACAVGRLRTSSRRALAVFHARALIVLAPSCFTSIPRLVSAIPLPGSSSWLLFVVASLGYGWMLACARAPTWCCSAVCIPRALLHVLPLFLGACSICSATMAFHPVAGTAPGSLPPPLACLHGPSRLCT